MRQLIVGGRWLLLLLGTVACQAQPAPATPPATPVAPATVAPTAAPSPTSVALPTGSSRVQVLVAGNDAFQRGDLKTSTDFYQRALNTPPTAGEAPALTDAIDGFARFRSIVALAARGEEDAARQQLQALQSANPNGAFTRLANQFWDQYGMTGSASAACNALRAQVVSQAGGALTALGEAGVSVQPEALCSVPR